MLFVVFVVLPALAQSAFLLNDPNPCWGNWHGSEQYCNCTIDETNREITLNKCVIPTTAQDPTKLRVWGNAFFHLSNGKKSWFNNQPKWPGTLIPMQITSVKTDAFQDSSLAQVKTFQLFNLGTADRPLQTITREFFSGLKPGVVEWITLSSNYQAGVADDAFSDIGPGIKKLYITGEYSPTDQRYVGGGRLNAENKLGSRLLSNLTNSGFNALQLNGLHIEEIDSEAFSSITWNNGLLDLAGNAISMPALMAGGAIAKAQKPLVINLGHNNLEGTLDCAFLGGMKHWNLDVQLNGNRNLSSIPEDCFSHSKEGINSLNILDTNIIDFPPNLFNQPSISRFGSLQMGYKDTNPAQQEGRHSKLSPAHFEPIKSTLQKLYLYHLRLTTEQLPDFTQMPSLFVLDLKGDTFSTLSCCSSQMLYLFITENHGLRHLPDTILSGRKGFFFDITGSDKVGCVGSAIASFCQPHAADCAQGLASCPCKKTRTASSVVLDSICSVEVTQVAVEVDASLSSPSEAEVVLGVANVTSDTHSTRLVRSVTPSLGTDTFSIRRGQADVLSIAKSSPPHSIRISEDAVYIKNLVVTGTLNSSTKTYAQGRRLTLMEDEVVGNVGRAPSQVRHTNLGVDVAVDELRAEIAELRSEVAMLREIVCATIPAAAFCKSTTATTA